MFYRLPAQSATTFLFTLLQSQEDISYSSGWTSSTGSNNHPFSRHLNFLGQFSSDQSKWKGKIQTLWDSEAWRSSKEIFRSVDIFWISFLASNIWIMTFEGFLLLKCPKSLWNLNSQIKKNFRCLRKLFHYINWISIKWNETLKTND